eukprot:4817847-Amphidinium_carterae.1
MPNNVTRRPCAQAYYDTLRNARDVNSMIAYVGVSKPYDCVGMKLASTVEHPTLSFVDMVHTVRNAGPDA